MCLNVYFYRAVCVLVTKCPLKESTQQTAHQPGGELKSEVQSFQIEKLHLCSNGRKRKFYHQFSENNGSGHVGLGL